MLLSFFILLYRHASAGACRPRFFLNLFFLTFSLQCYRNPVLHAKNGQVFLIILHTHAQTPPRYVCMRVTLCRYALRDAQHLHSGRFQRAAAARHHLLQQRHRLFCILQRAALHPIRVAQPGGELGPTVHEF